MNTVAQNFDFLFVALCQQHALGILYVDPFMVIQ